MSKATLVRSATEDRIKNIEVAIEIVGEISHRHLEGRLGGDSDNSHVAG